MTGKMIGNEYRTTVVCVDHYDDRVLKGRIYNLFCPEGKPFNSLMNFLLEMENLLDEMKFPQPFSNRRTFSDINAVHLAAAITDREERGFLATFRVRVLFRQNASWQGSVLWGEGAQEESFRSVLELVLLMESALNQDDGSGKNWMQLPEESLTREEYRHILHTAQQMGRERTYMMIKTIVGAGVRDEGLRKLTVEAVEQGSTWVVEYGRKRLVEIPEPLRSELLNYVAKKGIREGPVFVSKNGPMTHAHVSKDIRMVCQQAGIPEGKGTPNGLYKLSQAIRQAINVGVVEQNRNRLQTLLEEEEAYIAWNEPNK